MAWKEIKYTYKQSVLTLARNITYVSIKNCKPASSDSDVVGDFSSLLVVVPRDTGLPLLAKVPLPAVTHSVQYLGSCPYVKSSTIQNFTPVSWSSRVGGRVSLVVVADLPCLEVLPLLV